MQNENSTEEIVVLANRLRMPPQGQPVGRTLLASGLIAAPGVGVHPQLNFRVICDESGCGDPQPWPPISFGPGL
jgi:hypothetical protein